ncbi:uncharacterized protein J7T54_005789 [Emericellopsis cladophorae]|uniref:DUF7730 domain-containing protein n=1 Tax=Emericellopsis cladophorae TaxID=2686198 RepID=A0A9P9XYN6_9HYPO|nr:uncharacterized protein J7T54_005789 [Emericellopsis cladophorae]KAI6779759.1 hypothetical protein J7T54_005789 [Emericellopsis cladophorae]
MNNAFTPWAAPPPVIFPFLRLPAEVRNMIYEHVFILDVHIELAIRDDNATHLSASSPYKCHCAQHADERKAVSHHFLALLEACRLTKREAAPILYGKNVFCFGDWRVWKPGNLAIAHRTLQRIGATNLNFIKAIALHVDALPSVIARDYTVPPGTWPAWRIPAPYPQGDLVRYIAAMCPRIDTIYLGHIDRLTAWVNLLDMQHHEVGIRTANMELILHLFKATTKWLKPTGSTIRIVIGCYAPRPPGHIVTPLNPYEWPTYLAEWQDRFDFIDMDWVHEEEEYGDEEEEWVELERDELEEYMTNEHVNVDQRFKRAALEAGWEILPRGRLFVEPMGKKPRPESDPVKRPENGHDS